MLTTGAGAERLGSGATGLEPGDALDLDLPGGGTLNVTAVAADHGPPEVAAVNGPVIGFVLRAEGLPTIYVSGDNASVDVVRDVKREHGPFDVAVLRRRAQVPERWGEDAPLTLTPEAAVEAAVELARRRSSRSTRTAGRTSPPTAATSSGVLGRRPRRPPAPRPARRDDRPGLRLRERVEQGAGRLVGRAQHLRVRCDRQRLPRRLDERIDVERDPWRSRRRLRQGDR